MLLAARNGRLIEERERLPYGGAARARRLAVSGRAASACDAHSRTTVARWPQRGAHEPLGTRVWVNLGVHLAPTSGYSHARPITICGRAHWKRNTPNPSERSATLLRPPRQRRTYVRARRSEM